MAYNQFLCVFFSSPLRQRKNNHHRVIKPLILLKTSANKRFFHFLTEISSFISVYFVYAFPK